MRMCLVWVVLSSFPSSIFAQPTDDTVYAGRARVTEKAVIGGTTFPVSSTLRLDGLLTSGATDVLMINGSNEVVRRVLVRADLPSAIAYEDESNTFSAGNLFTSTVGITGVLSGSTGTLLVGSPTRISTTNPRFLLHDSDAATNAKYSVLESDAGSWFLNFYDDSLSSFSNILRIDRTGIVPGDLRFGSLLSTFRCENNGGCSGGSLNKKFLTLHAWELWVQTLVAQSTIATIGGSVLVAPTTEITRDNAAADAVIYVKHNQIRTNDTLMLQSGGTFEKMLVAGNAVDCSQSGNCPSVANDFQYSVTRGIGGTGANDWAAGSAVVNTGNTGDGMISLISERSATFGGYVEQVISDAPIFFWRMAETSSGQSQDVMGTGLALGEAGTQSNGLGVATVMIGQGGDPAWENIGAAGRLTASNVGGLQQVGDLTLEFVASWAPTIVDTDVILSRNFTGEYHVQVLSTGALQFCHGNTSTFTCVSTASGVMPTSGTGDHYAFVRDSVSSPKRILFYKNGVLHTQWTYTQTVTASSNNFAVGDNPSATGTAFDGYIDEVAIYNYQVPEARLLIHSQSRGNAYISRFTMGPSIYGTVRTGSGATDEALRWIIGNMAGTYGYASSTTPVYGLAAGVESGTHVTVESTNGFRVMNGSTTKWQADTSGNMFIGGNMTIASGGSIIGGNFTLNTSGLEVPVTTSSTFDSPFAFKWTGSTMGGNMFIQGWDFSGNARGLLITNDVASSANQGIIALRATAGGTAQVASVTVNASGTSISNASFVSFTVGTQILSYVNNTAAGTYYFAPSTNSLVDLGISGQRFKELWLTPASGALGTGTYPLGLVSATGRVVQIDSNTFTGTCSAASFFVINGLVQSC